MKKYHSEITNVPPLSSRFSNISSLEESSGSRSHLIKSDRVQSYTVSLGDYIHRRKFNQQKKIFELTKSLNVGKQDDFKAKQLAFQKQNLLRLCDRISLEIENRKNEIKQMDINQIKSSEQFLLKVIQIVSTKSILGDSRKKNSSTFQTSISTNGISLISSNRSKSDYLQRDLMNRIGMFKEDLKTHYGNQKTQENIKQRIKQKVKEKMKQKQIIKQKLSLTQKKEEKRGSCLKKQQNHHRKPINPNQIPRISLPCNNICQLQIQSQNESSESSQSGHQSEQFSKLNLSSNIQVKATSSINNLRKLKSLLTPSTQKRSVRFV